MSGAAPSKGAALGNRGRAPSPSSYISRTKYRRKGALRQPRGPSTQGAPACAGPQATIVVDGGARHAAAGVSQPITLAQVEATFAGDGRQALERLARAEIPAAWPGRALVERAFCASLDAIRADRGRASGATVSSSRSRTTRRRSGLSSDAHLPREAPRRHRRGRLRDRGALAAKGVRERSDPRLRRLGPRPGGRPRRHRDHPAVARRVDPRPRARRPGEDRDGGARVARRGPSLRATPRVTRRSFRDG